MTAPTEPELMIFSTVLIVLVLAYVMKFQWNLPLRNGPGFFLGVEVPAGFYDGPGRLWLRNYRGMLIALHVVLIVFFGVCFALRWWDSVPLCGYWAVPYLVSMNALHAWARHKLGANPPVHPVALSLESRRLGDYISWPMEVLSAAIIASSWWVLLRHGAKFDWLFPLQMTWAAIVLPAKIMFVRSGAPLPAERTEEHYRYQDAMRRNRIHLMNAWGWLMVVVLAGYSLRQIVPPKASHTLVWISLCIMTAVFAYMMVVNFRGQRLAATMGRDLRPAGSWATPYRGASGTQRNRPYLIWLIIWFAGFVALLLYPHFR